MNKITLIIIYLFAAKAAWGQICVGTPGELEWHAWNGLYDDEISELTALPSFPDRPEVIKPLFRLQAPINYNNYFGSRVEGFLHVESESTVTFNVTGNRYVRFYLSTDADPENKILVAFTPESTDQEEHSIYPEQTSNSITLLPGVEYYFEVVHVDGGGSDHWAVWWQTDLVDPANWNIITAAFLSGVGCKDAVCPDPGTPCDDGDATTENDIEDGHCNCFGSKITSNPCIGERGALEAYRYDNIEGGSLNDLYEAENFPGMPASSETYEYFSRPTSNNYANIGFAIQAYLTVPVTGLYKFNVTGDDYTILFLSSDESPENRQAHQMLVSGWTYMTEHTKYIYQSSSFIQLEKGKYYYIEINQKDGGGSEHFGAFWQTPFTKNGEWKRIPDFYFHDYKCEIACIPQGTPCDDGDPFTNDDAYDANCECVGIPCSGPDCDSPLANYVPYDPCATSEYLDNRAGNNWISCETSASPNADRQESHWIMYDLGQRYELHGSQIWNYNVPGETSRGMQLIGVDISDDGNNWQELGEFNLQLATGDSGYGGVQGPDFDGHYARYILFTSLINNTSCKGLGKVAFTAVACPQIGLQCDDGDELTFNDVIDSNCECRGSAFDENDCAEDNIILGDSTLYTGKYSAINEISSISTIAGSNSVSFVGGSSIVLEPGFETNGSAYFLASIDDCIQNNLRQEIFTREAIQAEKRAAKDMDKEKGLVIHYLDDGQVMVGFYVEKPGRNTLEIYDRYNKKKFSLIDHEFTNKGLYYKRFPTSKFESGQYLVQLKSAEKTQNEKLTIGG